jgi:hypothetical protein
MIVGDFFLVVAVVVEELIIVAADEGEMILYSIVD